MTSLLQLFILAGALFSHLAAAQNCGCASNLCCSKYGYCGTSAAYCGDGCQQGPCFSGGGGGGGGGVNVADVVSDGFFNGMLNQAADSCAGKRFYSRRAFLIALRSYPKFGKEGSADVAKREIAAFFAHVTHETGHFCYINEINGASRDYCDKSNTQWPCNPNKKYFGRGPIQLSWNFNYGPAGKSIGFDGLNDPEAVSKDPVVAFKTAFWYWMNHVHSLILSNRGFGSTIRAINSIECNGGNTLAINSRVRYYIQYCKQLGISPGTNLRC